MLKKKIEIYAQHLSSCTPVKRAISIHDEELSCNDDDDDDEQELNVKSKGDEQSWANGSV